MRTYLITLDKTEVTKAILNYVSSSITVEGRKELKDPTISFSDRDGDIGYLTCSIEVNNTSPTQVTPTSEGEK